MTKIPAWTCGITVASLAVYFTPSLESLFIYDRNAVFSGELWRIVSCYLVHYSPSHLFYNSIVFLIVGVLIEQRDHSFLGALCLVVDASRWAPPFTMGTESPMRGEKRRDLKAFLNSGRCSRVLPD
ncbi:rhomboid family intramembrane serine protease [Nitrospina sp. 32_T5]|uniref:rhomboid family intramembrane serine protease n=1 Tax=unclassified Nitrospina TaxID=2638683 RepID=UPI003F97D45D